MKHRDIWIDNLRGIGIFFVVLLHTGRVESLLVTELIKSFLLPLFFFISGLLFNKETTKLSFGDYFKKVGSRILIPYLTFSIGSYLAWFFLFQNFKEKEFYPLKALMGIFYGSASKGYLDFNIALWFFPCFFVSQIMFYSLLRLSNNNYKLSACLILLSIIGYTFTSYATTPDTRLPWGFEIALTSTVFCGIGFLAKPYVSKSIYWSNKRFLAGMFISLSIWVSMSLLNTTVEFFVGVYGNYFLFYGASISGIFFWLLLSQKLGSNYLLKIAGQNTLVIFPMHLLVIPLITGFLVYILKIPKNLVDSGLIIAIGYAIVSIAAIIPFSIFLNQKFPIVLGKAKM